MSERYDGDGAAGGGGAIFVYNGSLTVTNTIFTSNEVRRGNGTSGGDPGKSVGANIYVHDSGGFVGLGDVTNTFNPPAGSQDVGGIEGIQVD